MINFRKKNRIEAINLNGNVDIREKIIIDDKSDLNFIVFGDPQISHLSPIRTTRFEACCEDIAKIDGRLDAVVVVGDVVEMGRSDEYRVFSDIINKVSDKFGSFFAVSGNHDVRLRNYKKQLFRFNEFISSVSGGKIGSYEHYWFSKEIKGYKFIFMGTDRPTFEGAYISQKQLEWLDKELTAADSTDKPVFVFNHQTLKHHNGLPHTWLGKGKWRGSIGNQSDKIKQLFNRHSDIIFITGHLHYCVNKYTYEDYGKYKSISIPTLCVNNHGDYPEECQSYVFSVYKDKIIARARLFDRGKYVDANVANSYIEINL